MNGPLTHDDLSELEAIAGKLGETRQAVLDLAERCRRKGDHKRAAAIEVRVAWPIEHAGQVLEEAFS